MGLMFSRQNENENEPDSSSNMYRYPPKSGRYFSSHFVMGGERFEIADPEAYLFGDNSDLNFLGGHPCPFPYAAPQPNEPTRTLRALMNIRKESLRFVKAPEAHILDPHERTTDSESSSRYNIEFTFDSDVRCAITIRYFCTEEITSNEIVYKSKDCSLDSETFYYKKGVSQLFRQENHVFDPSIYSPESLNYSFDDEVIPVCIQFVAEEGDEPRQSHILLAIVEKLPPPNGYCLKPLKQKLFVDGLSYLLQEIYGIENKNLVQHNALHKENEDDSESGSECVICINDVRNTLILPCRHLCLCHGCADSLRYQSSNCPICRVPFRALLQISAVRKINNTLSQVVHNGENQAFPDIPPGYEPVSLIEALNGPMQPPASLVPAFGSKKISQIPPFANSPDIQQKHRHVERHHSSSASHSDNISSEKSEPSEKVDGASATPPEVIVASSISSSEKVVLKSESLSLTRGECRRHRKGFRTSSAPEKMRLLANSVQIVNEVSSAKRKIERDSELAETKSLLESSANAEEISESVLSSPKASRPCSQNSPISLSTPHSLHLCEKSSKDTSPGGDDSDYYTPEDPSTTILVDQGTDTSLDTPQGSEARHINDSVAKTRNEYALGKHKVNRERHPVVDEASVGDGDLSIPDENKRNSDPLKKTENSSSHLKSSNSHSLVVNLENPNSLPSTPASNASNSGDSFSSTSSTHLLHRPRSFDILPE